MLDRIGKIQGAQGSELKPTLTPGAFNWVRIWRALRAVRLFRRQTGQSIEMVNEQSRSRVEDGVATFFSRTYDDAIGLLQEARIYLGGAGRADLRALSVSDRLLYSCESARLTARLTQIMAWLLLQRALFAGEVSRDWIRTHHGDMIGHDICLAQDADHVERLPGPLRTLMARSESLYRRAQHLHELVLQQA